MKKTLIALMALAGVAAAAEPVASGSYTLNMSQWTTGDDTLYNYLYGAINEGGTLTFDLTINYDGTNCNAYQTLLHIGSKDAGISIMANGGPKLIIGEQHETSDYPQYNHELGTPSLVTGSNLVSITIKGNETPGTASVAITMGGVVYSAAAGTDHVADLEWDKMYWNTTNGEAAKYSVNVGAPGWDTLFPAQCTTLTAATATYMAIPEPTTATLSLLALAGLAARRRRR